MPDSPLIVLSTVPDRTTAGRIAEILVDERLAACVNIVDHVTSVYRWRDNLEKDDEMLLIIKTAGHVFEPLKQRVLELHPYELPEIVAVPVTTGHAGYLDWLNHCLE